MILAIDTSAGTAVAVVDRDGGVLAERSVADTRRHAEVIGTLIDEALTAAAVTPSQLSAVVAGIGPGPFTGLRVGIAAARAFAFGAGVPSLSVGSHDAIAFEQAVVRRAAVRSPTPAARSTRRSSSSPTRVAARSPGAPWSGLDDDGLPVLVEGPALAKPADLDEATGASSSWARTDPDAVEVSAAALGMLAERLFEHGRAFADDRAALPARARRDAVGRPEAGESMTHLLRTCPARRPRRHHGDRDRRCSRTTPGRAAPWRTSSARATGWYLVATPDGDDTRIVGYAGMLAPIGTGDADIQTIAVAPEHAATGSGGRS